MHNRVSKHSIGYKELETEICCIFCIRRYFLKINAISIKNIFTGQGENDFTPEGTVLLFIPWQEMISYEQL